MLKIVASELLSEPCLEEEEEEEASPQLSEDFSEAAYLLGKYYQLLCKFSLWP